ncbi:hypothetical protein VE00_04278 [Pseudogymnoascus sp. WSF 3629]|nr:hypothetical protein VE00_04278 [Pseudogymnoascus sp. WSF 3629]
MKEDETFTEFYTCFLHLVGMGKIPMEDLQPDFKELAHKCLLVNKNLRRLQQR